MCPKIRDFYYKQITFINNLSLILLMPDKEKDIGLTVKKSENFSDWFTQICSERGAKLADVRYGVQGFVVVRELGFLIARKIYELLENTVELDGHEPLLFPSVIPEENLMKEKEHAGFTPEVFWITHAGDQELERKIALRPTGETAIYPMYSLWIRSYQDLPFKKYQSRITVFRNEMATRPFLRGREFLFFETHDVFEKHSDALKQIKKDMQIMNNVIWNKLKIPFIFLKRPKWDAFKGANATYVSDTLLPDGRRNQISSTHDLGQNFAKAFNVNFTDRNGDTKFGWQTCFGPGIARLVASIVSIHGDDTGLVLPVVVAPVQIVIVPIIFKDIQANKRVLKEARKLLKKLQRWGYRTKLDDSDQTPGYKFNQWELMGVPIRIEIGPREAEQGFVTLVRRTSKEKIKIEIASLKKLLPEHSNKLDQDIEQRAKTYFENNTRDAHTLEELKHVFEEHRGFVRIPFCEVETNEGKNCADQIKTLTNGADVCGTKFDVKEEPTDACCLVCKKPAKHLVYVAKSI